MSIHDSHDGSSNDSENEERADMRETHDNSGFEPIEFGAGFDPAPAHSTPIIYDFEDNQDSWALDGLYCENLSHPHRDAGSMPVLDDKHAILSWAATTLAASPSARIMLNEAQDNGWYVAIENIEGGKTAPDFQINVPEKTIILSDQGLPSASLGASGYFKNALLVSFIRALRDVWQEKRHGAFDEDYGPERVLMLERVRAADLDVLTVLVGWELRGEGEGALWRHLIGAQNGDIAMRFSGHLERDPTSLFNGNALAAAFKQWFRDETRVNDCDHEALNYVDTIVQESGQSAFGDKKLTAIGIEVLSCLPDRTAYLQGMGSEIQGDPVYAGLTDPINQAHFAQIIYDLRVVRVQNVPFRNARLAELIFPNGEFTPEPSDTLH